MNLKYWVDFSFQSNYTPTDKYIVTDWYHAGFNNFRMTFEIASVLSYTLNRKLIIPGPRKIPHLQEKKFSISDFFDIENFVINYEESYDEFLKDSHDVITINYPSHDTLYKVDNSPVPDYFKGTNIVNLHEMENIKFLHFPGNLFGNFYHAISHTNITDICKMVKKHIHYKESIFDNAKKCIDILGDQQYYAIHIRRGDFLTGGADSWMWNFITMSAEKILENIENIIPINSKLYIATDEKDKTYFLPFKEKYDIYFYDDIKCDKIEEHTVGLIEQIICSRSKTFVGTFVSTFSTYINRLRGYMSDIEDKRVLNFSNKYDNDFFDDEKFNGLYSREYSIGWNF
jgi:hypothetical protein